MKLQADTPGPPSKAADEGSLIPPSAVVDSRGDQSGSEVSDASGSRERRSLPRHGSPSFTLHHLPLTTRLFLFASGYFLAYIAALLLRSPTESLLPVWPPLGVYAAALVLTPRRQWLSMMLVAGIVTILVGEFAERPVSESGLGTVAIFLTDTLLAFASGTLFQRTMSLPFAMNSLRRVLMFAAGAIALATLAGAGHAWANWQPGARVLPLHYLHWMMANLIGVWFLGFPLLSIFPLGQRIPVLTRRSTLLEGVILLVVLWLSSHVVFSDWAPWFSFTPFILPALMWTALRFGARGVDVAMLLLVVVSVGALWRGTGPYSRVPEGVHIGVLQTQFFLFSWSVFLHATAAILVERQQANSALEEINSELTFRVESRTAELRRVNASLHESDRRKDQFLAMLAHELRNPLAPILNSIQFLQRSESTDANTRQAQAMVERQVKHMSRLIDDLLDVARIGRGKIRLERTLCDLTSILRTTCEDQRPVLESRGIQFLVDLPADPFLVTGDETRIAQMVGNLLHNAGKFTDRNGLVALRASRSPDLKSVVIRVSDTGIGMDQATQERVFDAFSQADTGLVRTQGGLGLGLALVKGLADMHFGSVQCFSEGLGRGSTFSVTLPLAQASVSEARAADEPANRLEQSFRVLVIEDNVDAAVSLRLLLQSLGHEVRVSHTGVDGVAEARRWSPQVILCDIGLPGMDGYEVCRVLRQETATRDAWILSQSGYGQMEDHRRSASAGFDRHLTKPLDFTELAALLANHRPAMPTAFAG